MPVKSKKRRVVTVLSDPRPSVPVDFHFEIETLLQDRPPTIDLDCSLLNHANSTHIHALWWAKERCEAAGTQLRLTAVTPHLERTLKLLDLYDLFEVDRESAKQRSLACERDRAPAAIELEFEASDERIGEAVRRFCDFMTGLNLGTIFIFDLRTVFYEVAANIRLHGHLKQGEAILFSVRVADGCLHMRFEDRGLPFDPTQVASTCDPQHAIKHGQRRGFGLVLIKRLVDTIAYERLDDRVNALTLARKLQWKEM